MPSSMLFNVIDAQFLASSTTPEGLPAPEFPEFAFAGRSNVGKSSLINTLVARKKLVRTSNTPGCTRALNSFRVTFKEAVIDFVDLPGYGFAKRSKSERSGWGPLIERFLQKRANLFGVVLILDVRRGLEDDDKQLLDFLAHIKRPALVVATKTDKLSGSALKPVMDALSKEAGQRVIPFSSENGTGRDLVWRQLFGAAHLELPEAPARAATKTA